MSAKQIYIKLKYILISISDIIIIIIILMILLHQISIMKTNIIQCIYRYMFKAFKFIHLN